MTLKLYYDPLSQPSRAVLLFIRYNSIPCEEIKVAIQKGEHLTEEFAKINPFKKLPAIELENQFLTESVAILKFLCCKYNVCDHWYSKDAWKKARVDEFMAWQHMNLRFYASMYFQTKIVRPLLSGEPVNEKRLKFYQRGLNSILDEIERIWLKDKLFLCGAELTIADLLAVSELEQPAMAGLDVKEGRKRLSEYMETVKGRLQPHYDDVFAKMFKIKAIYTAKL